MAELCVCRQKLLYLFLPPPSAPPKPSSGHSCSSPFSRSTNVDWHPLVLLCYRLFPRTGIDDREGHDTGKQLSAHALQPKPTIFFKVQDFCYFLPSRSPTLTIQDLRKVSLRDLQRGACKGTQATPDLGTIPTRMGNIWISVLGATWHSHQLLVPMPGPGSNADFPRLPAAPPVGRRPEAVRESISRHSSHSHNFALMSMATSRFGQPLRNGPK